MIDQLDALIVLKEKCDKYKTLHGTSFVAQIDDAIGGEFNCSTILYVYLCCRTQLIRKLYK